MTRVRRWTIEILKSRGREVHGDKYDYSKITGEISATMKVNIICTTCKYEFLQQVTAHINDKQGCINCAGKIPFNYDTFIKKAVSVHGDKYNYSKIIPDDIISGKSKVCIVCNTCDYEFLQCIANHINAKQGCSNCANQLQYNCERFIKKATVIHGDKYNYSKVPTNGDFTKKTKVPIICNKCNNEFLQSISDHITCKSGCTRCNNSKGELSVESYLKNNNIDYEMQYILSSLPKKKIRFCIA